MGKQNLLQHAVPRTEFISGLSDDDEERNSPYLGYLLNEAAYIIRRETENELKPFNLSPRLFGILDTIARKEPLSQHALGELRKIDRTTIVGYVDQLEAASLIKREDNPKDRREYALVMTAKGNKTVGQAREAVRRVETQFLKNLPPEDCEKLLEILLQLFQTQNEKVVLEMPDEINSLCLADNTVAIIRQ